MMMKYIGLTTICTQVTWPEVPFKKLSQMGKGLTLGIGNV